MERDEVYVPKTRKDLNIPEKPNDQIDWDEIFGDTPIYTLYMLMRQQLLAFPAYLRGYLTKLLGASCLTCINSLQRFWSKRLSKVDKPF
jgi:hypothetical protein